ncbi:MAG: transposase [Candidatus Binatia bacterium]
MARRKLARRTRRKFTAEFKAETVKLIRESDRSIGEISRELGLSETAVRRWLKQAEIDDGKGPAGALTTDEQAELRRLRRENRELQMEREILKKPLLQFMWVSGGADPAECHRSRGRA